MSTQHTRCCTRTVHYVYTKHTKLFHGSRVPALIPSGSSLIHTFLYLWAPPTHKAFIQSPTLAPADLVRSGDNSGNNHRGTFPCSERRGNGIWPSCNTRKSPQAVNQQQCRSAPEISAIFLALAVFHCGTSMYTQLNMGSYCMPS